MIYQSRILKLGRTPERHQFRYVETNIDGKPLYDPDSTPWQDVPVVTEKESE